MCPELREQAVAALPEAAWQALVAGVRARTPAAPAEAPRWTELRETLLDARGCLADAFIPWAATVLACVLLALTLTLIADATR